MLNTVVALLFILNLLDIYTTRKALRLYGVEEKNVVLDRLMKKFGFWPVVVIIKFIFVIQTFFICVFLWQSFLYLVTAFYMYVVSNNFIVISKVKSQVR